MLSKSKLYRGGGWLVGWMLDGWLEKAELKPTQPSLAGAWLSLAIEKISVKKIWIRNFIGLNKNREG